MRWFSRRGLGTSVERRIALLVAVAAATIALLIFLMFRAFSNISGELEYSGRFMLAPTEAIPDAIEEAASLAPRSPVKMPGHTMTCFVHSSVRSRG